MKNIGVFIQEQRKKIGMSQVDLAEKLSVSRSFMSKIENGKTPLSLKRLDEIGNILEIEMFDYLSDEYKVDKKWDQVIKMFEDNDLEPSDILLLESFIKQLKSN